jgi:hypothetical protein
MTDPQAPQSKPDIEDVVERANAGLAEAEAAGRAATASRTPAPAQNAAANDAAANDAAPQDAAAPDQTAPGSEGSPAAPDAVQAGDGSGAQHTPAADPPAESAEAAAESADPAEPDGGAPLWPAAGASDQAVPAETTVEPVGSQTPAPAETAAASDGGVPAEPASDADATSAHEPAVAASVAEPAADARTVEAPAESTAPADDAETRAIPDAAATAVLAGGAGAAAAASAPAAAPAEPTGLTAIAGPRPVYVAAPEPPTPRGNRGAAGLIGLVAAVAFAVLYLGAWALVDLARGTFAVSALGNRVLDQLATADLWTPTVVFFLGFWLLGVFINRARWGYWVVFGILVGVAAYIGHIAGQLAHAQAWNLTYAASEKLVTAELFAPLSIAAFIIGRELTIWFGAWVAARGRKVTALNLAAQEEYERSLEAGPQASAERS